MTALLIGEFSPESLQAVELAAFEVNVTVTVYATVDRAREGLSDLRAPVARCVFVQARAPGVASFVAWMRGEARLFAVPLVLVVPQFDEFAYAEAHPLGADDVIGISDPDGFRRRLTNLADVDVTIRPPMTQGLAVVAHPDLGRRQILGRTLRQVGFNVAFAGDRAEMLAMANGQQCRLVVLWSGLPPDGAAGVVRELRANPLQSPLPIIIVASVNSPVIHGDAREDSMLVVSTEEAPPQDLVFLANEMLRRRDFQEFRTAPRMLYSALCAFRTAGDLWSDYGVTYNLSREGLYIRTLVPSERTSEVWVEFRPPGSASAVHLRGQTVWTKRYGGGGAAPPGFGLRLLAEKCPKEDLSAYQNSYDSVCPQLS